MTICIDFRNIGSSLQLLLETETPQLTPEQLEIAAQCYAIETFEYSHPRKVEFLMGRVLCEELLAKFGYPHFHVGVSDIGAPLWPDSLVGSLSHDAGHFLVCAAFTGHMEYLGVDIHVLLPLRKMLRILKAFDSSHLASLQSFFTETGLNTEQLLNALWCAKEAAYKTLASEFQPSNLCDFSVVYVNESLDSSNGCDILLDYKGLFFRKVSVTFRSNYAMAFCSSTDINYARLIQENKCCKISD